MTDVKRRLTQNGDTSVFKLNAFDRRFDLILQNLSQFFSYNFWNGSNASTVSRFYPRFPFDTPVHPLKFSYFELTETLLLP